MTTRDSEQQPSSVIGEEQIRGYSGRLKRSFPGRRLAPLPRLFLVAGICAVLLGSSSCRGGYSGPVETITIGTMANAGDTLIFTAEQQEYFAANGIDVTLKTYINGLSATDAMLAGEVDLAYATEFVVVGKALQKEEIYIITTYSKNITVALVGRKDLGIDSVPDLKGKRIGLARGSINEFYLGRMLMLNNMGMGDITLIDLASSDLGDALGSGNVDAIVAGSKNLYPLVQQQGSELFSWPAHSDQPACGTLVGKKDWVINHAELIKRLLQSLSEAEQYLNSNPDIVRSAVREKLGFDNEYMTSVWAEYQFSLSIDQSLITAMEDEARWMIAGGMTAETQVPNFLDHIYEEALENVKPEAVNIIR